MRLIKWAVAVLALAQAWPVSAAPYRAPRTASGAPDLQGLWTNLSLTRLERPPELATLVIPDADAATAERRIADRVAHPANDVVGNHESEWWDDAHLGRIEGHARSSWIVSPADGKLPYTPLGKQRVADLKASVQSLDNPESRDAMERCLMPSFGAVGPPILNSPYTANYQIVQTADRVVIFAEVNHEARIIRLNGNHAPAAVRSWTGDSIGHWERETLVVETTNVLAVASSRMPSLYISPDARITERFTRVSPTEIRYEFAVEDPAIYTQAWRGEEPFRATKGPIYEFACHEGNYGLEGILAGARHVEGEPKPSPP